MVCNIHIIGEMNYSPFISLYTAGVPHAVWLKPAFPEIRRFENEDMF